MSIKSTLFGDFAFTCQTKLMNHPLYGQTIKFYCKYTDFDFYLIQMCDNKSFM